MYFSMDLSFERNCARHRVLWTERSSTGGIKPRFTFGDARKETTMNRVNMFNMYNEPCDDGLDLWMPLGLVVVARSAVMAENK
jgi:hypothetical protein